MPLNLENDCFNNIIEVWGIGQNAIEVVTENHRRFRVYAGRNIRSGATPNFYAIYEESIEIGKGKAVFASVSMPWQNGNTIEECLLGALGWINERG